MRGKRMKHTHTKNSKITLLLSQTVIDELQVIAKKRGISRFVEEAVTEKLQRMKSDLEQQYIEAAKDEERNKIFLEWEHMIGDGLN